MASQNPEYVKRSDFQDIDFLILLFLILTNENGDITTQDSGVHIAFCG